MTKVLRIINRFNLGGPTYNAAYLTRYLPSDFETLLIGGLHDESEESSDFILNQLGVDFQKIHSMKRSLNFKDDRKAYLEIRQIIRDFQPDIVHTHASKAGALGRLAASAEGVDHIIHTFHGHVFHSYFGKAKTLVYKNIERRLAKKSEKIIAISPIQKIELSKVHNICPPEKIAIIPLGFDLNRFLSIDPSQKLHSDFRKKWRIQEDEIAIGIIGRLAPIKNHQLFIRIIHKLRSSGLKVRAMIIGDGDMNHAIKQEIEALGMSWADEEGQLSDFSFCGWMKEIEIPLKGLNIVALTSLNEGTPVSLIEAQASAVPVVSTDVGGVKDVLPQAAYTFVSPSGDEEGLSAALIKLCRSEDLRNQLGIQGRAHVRDQYNYQRLVDDHVRLYRELMEG